jgi:hypothetical protein
MMTMNWAAAIRPKASQRWRLGIPGDVVELMMVPLRDVGPPGWRLPTGASRHLLSAPCLVAVGVDPVDVEARPLQRGQDALTGH